MAMVVFLEMNASILDVCEDDAVEVMLSVAAGETDEAALTVWLSQRLNPDHAGE